MRFSDGGGVFGFFLGVTMLNCLQTTFEHTLNWSSKIRKRNREKAINISQERSKELSVSHRLCEIVYKIYQVTYNMLHILSKSLSFPMNRERFHL